MEQPKNAALLWKIFQTVTDERKPYLQKLIDDPNVSGIDLGYKVFERLKESDKDAERDFGSLAIRLHVLQKNMEKCTLAEGVEDLKGEGDQADFRRMVRQDTGHDKRRNYYHEFIQLVMDDLQLNGELGREVELVFSRDTDIIQMKHRNRSGAFGEQPINMAKDVIQPGMSVGHKNRRAGTMGTIVYDQRDGYPMLLSCWHVLSVPNAMPDSRILSPGPSDGGQPESDWVGMLEQRGSFPSHVGDAAVARLVDQGVSGRTYVRGQYGTDDGTGKPVVVEKVHRVTHEDLGERVIKSGKTTGVTEGIIDGVGIYFVDYRQRERIPVHGFKVVPEKGDTREISKPGDSGALWFRASDHAGLGLHFEGEKNLAFDAEQALACHLDPILEELDVTLQKPTS